jgi:hypothetical protein
MVTGTDCTGSCKSNYHTITTTTAACMVEMSKVLWKLADMTNFEMSSDASVSSRERERVKKKRCNKRLIVFIL